MKYTRLAACAVSLALAGGVPHSASATALFPHYVYTEDNIPSPGTNTVTTFSVDATGKLTNLGHTSTTGHGGDDLFAADHIGKGKTKTAGNLLLVANDGDGTVSVFTGVATGSLVLNNVIEFGGTANQDISMAANTTCMLFAVPSSSSTSVLWSAQTKSDGPFVSTVDLSAIPDGIKLVTVQKVMYAVIAQPFNSPPDVEVIPVSSTCILGTPFSIATANPDSGAPTDVDFSTNGETMYVADANGIGTIIEAFSFPSGTPKFGSPYIYPTSGTNPGINSNTLLVIGTCLYVGNQSSSTVSSIPLVSGGLPGSKIKGYPAGSNGEPSELAKDANSKSFYVASFIDNTVTTELIGKTCSLTEGPNSPAPTDAASGSGLLSLVSYP